MAYIQAYTSDEIYHHGILGQKWGVRRYQNEDGSLTEAGKSRLAKYQYRLNTANAKEYNRANARIDKKIGKLENTAAKQKEYGGIADPKIYSKIESLKKNKAYQEALYQAQKERIKNLDVTAYKKENSVLRLLGKRYVQGLAITGVGTAVALAAAIPVAGLPAATAAGILTPVATGISIGTGVADAAVGAKTWGDHLGITKDKTQGLLSVSERAKLKKEYQ